MNPKLMRPYASYNFFKLLRMKSFFFVCNYSIFIKNLRKIYLLTSKILGTQLTNKTIEVLYCDLLTGGTNFNHLQRKINLLEKENILSIVDYCREFLTDKDEEVI